MNSADITRLRLRNQFLSGRAAATPLEVVRHNGAVQSQDLPGAIWAVGQRIRKASESSVLAAYNAGEIVRMHVLRPTWHFVAPEDLRWMQALTGPRVQALNAGRYRELEIDAPLARKAMRIIEKALGTGEYLTRRQLAALLAEKGIAGIGNRIAHIFMWLELEALICSGPMRGSQTTYALVAEHIPRSIVLHGDEALSELARRFFTRHGPAQIRDFVFWSGLTVNHSRRALDILSGAIREETVDDETYFCSDSSRALMPRSPQVRLLPNYDEYLLSYRNRRHAGGSVDLSKIDADDLSAHFVVLDGHVVGGWKRTVARPGITVRVKLFTRLSREARTALDDEFERLRAFLDVPVEVSYI